MDDGAGLKYLMTDHLGSVEAVTDANGTLLSQQRYLPFGQVRSDAFAPGSIGQTDFAYTGQRNVDGLGLMDYKARFYDAALGRFVQPDTIIPSMADPQSWNRYSYVMNEPMGMTDPSGNFGKRRDDKSDYQNKIMEKKVRELEAKWEKEKVADLLKRELAMQRIERIEAMLARFNGFVIALPDAGKPQFDVTEPLPPTIELGRLVELGVGLFFLSAGFGVLALGATISSTALAVIAGTVVVASPFGLLIDGPHAAMALVIGSATMGVGIGLAYVGYRFVSDSLAHMPVGPFRRSPTAGPPD